MSARRRHGPLHDHNSSLPPSVVTWDDSASRKSDDSINFSNLTKNYVFAPAANFWNTAQALTDQYAQVLLTDVQSQPPAPLPFHSNPVSSSQAVDDPDDDIDPFQLTNMPYRDRTQEFKTVCKSFEMKLMANGRIVNRDDRNRQYEVSIEFNQRAKRIGRFLSITCAKIEKLTELTKKKSLFDDPGQEVDRLSKEVQEDIKGLYDQINDLSAVLQRQATRSNAQGTNHSNLVVTGLRSKLANVGETFKHLLEVRTQNLKTKKTNREKYCQAEPVPSSMPKSASNVLFIDDNAASESSGFGGAGGSANGGFVLEMGQNQHQDQAMLLDNTDTYYRDRLNAVGTIEASINELGQIFSQLAHLVQQQGEMITRIDSNVEHTAINVEAAHTELLRYFNNISRNRWLIIKVFGVLIAFIVFFIVFMA